MQGRKHAVPEGVISRMKAKRTRWRRMRPHLHATTAEPCPWLECLVPWPGLFIINGGVSVFVVADGMWHRYLQHGPVADRRTWSWVPRLLLQGALSRGAVEGRVVTKVLGARQWDM